jgi:hypothetical protein
MAQCDAVSILKLFGRSTRVAHDGITDAPPASFALDSLESKERNAFD